VNILAFDTATQVCTVALSNKDCVSFRHEHCPREHSNRLLPYIDALLSEAGIGFKDLDGIACGVGPGSFMGVRLAAGVAQGLAYTADLPLLPVSTLQALAQGAASAAQDLPVAAAWDARMGELYLGLYRADEHGIMQPLQADALIKPEALTLSMPVVAVGNAWSEYDAMLMPASKQLCSQLDVKATPTAEAMLVIAKAADAASWVSVNDFEVAYLRQAVTD